MKRERRTTGVGKSILGDGLQTHETNFLNITNNFPYLENLPYLNEEGMGSTVGLAKYLMRWSTNTCMSVIKPGLT